MKDELMQNQEWVELKATLRFVEDKILGITDSDKNWMLKKDLCEQVKELLRDRYTIMNKMFRLHVSKQEVERFRIVNDHLQELTQEIFQEHRNTSKFLADHLFEGVTHRSVVQVVSEMDVDNSGVLLHFADNDDYGSNFSKMADIIAWADDLEIHFCSSELGEDPDPDHLDSGRTWAEGCLDLPQFTDIVVCQAIHDLSTHKSYSIPDILRIANYTIRHTVTTKHTHMVSHDLNNVVYLISANVPS